MVYFVITYPWLALLIFLTAGLWFKVNISVASAIALLQVMNRLQTSMQMLPNFIGQLIEFLISLDRIQDFLKWDEIQREAIIDQTMGPTTDYSITIKNGNFHWGLEGLKKKKKGEKKEREESMGTSELSMRSATVSDSSELTSKLSLLSDNITSEEEEVVINQPKWILKNINIQVEHGEFIAIIGEVGAGKSSLISTLIGDTLREEIAPHNLQSNIRIEGSICLVEQIPWILNETLRNNILFGEELEEDRYNETIEICQLAKDLEMLDGGDLTQIGEKGINLSGGQKARLSLARAVYSWKDIVLMDDPLSALDAHVK